MLHVGTVTADVFDALADQPRFGIAWDFVDEIQPGQFPRFAAVTLVGFSWRRGVDNAPDGLSHMQHQEAQHYDGRPFAEVVRLDKLINLGN